MAITIAQLNAALADLGLPTTGLTEVHINGATNLLALGTTVTAVVSTGSMTTTTVTNVSLL